jgi:hypothetical protein
MPRKITEQEEIARSVPPAYASASINKSNPIQALNRKVLEAESRKRELHKIYKSEPKVQTYLSPQYRPYFGNVMRVMINGISIYFKVDGSTQSIPKTFADEISRRRKAIDRTQLAQSRMANVPENNERTPGELSIF